MAWGGGDGLGGRAGATLCNFLGPQLVRYTMCACFIWLFQFRGDPNEAS